MILKENNLPVGNEDAGTQPGMETMRHLQIKNNQLMALIASENKADSAEIAEMKKEFLIFWADDDY